MILTINHKLCRRTGVRMRCLPTTGETKRAIHRYLQSLKKKRKYPTVEQLRKGIYSPSTGWTKEYLRKLVQEMGYRVRRDDRIVGPAELKYVDEASVL